MSLLDLVKDNLGGDAIGQLAGKIGIDPATANAAVAAALPAIVSALAKNAKSDDGAAKLDKALEKHDGGVAEKLKAAAPDLLAEGAKILGHVFGNKQAAAQGQVAKAATGSGIDMSKIGDLLAGLAPVVMSALQEKKKTQGLDAAGLSQSLQADSAQAKQEAGGTFSFLDADGDGDIMDDLADKGSSLLGGLFGGDKKA